MKSLKKALFELPLPQAVKKDVIALGIAKKFWKEIVGDEFSKKAKPYCVSHGTLVIEVENSMLAQIISLNASSYLEKLNQKVPTKYGKLFKEVKIKLFLEKNKKTNPSKFQKIDKESYLASCSFIKNKELKEVFESLIKAYLKVISRRSTL